MTGEDGKAYPVGKNLEVARVQTENPERTILKASVKDAAGEQVARIAKAVVVRTVGFETARANVVRQSEALDANDTAGSCRREHPRCSCTHRPWGGRAQGENAEKKVPAQRAWCAGV